MIEKKVKLDDIIVLPDRTRTSKEKSPEMERLKDSIKKLGLFHPILINDDNELIAGFRRLTAFKQLRLEDSVRFNVIAVRILPSADEYRQLMAEIHENWARKELKGYELDTALARLKRVYQKLHPETKEHVAGGIAKSRKSKKKSADGGTATAREKTPRFEEYIADDLMQKSASTIEKRVRVGEAVENKEIFTENEVEAYREGETSHTKMLKKYELRKKLADSLNTEKKKAKTRIRKNGSDVIFMDVEPEGIIQPGKPIDFTFKEPEPEQYECILSVDSGVRQKISGLTIKEVREWYTTILLSDKLWDEIEEPDEITVGIVSLSEKDRILGL